MNEKKDEILKEYTTLTEGISDDELDKMLKKGSRNPGTPTWILTTFKTNISPAFTFSEGVEPVIVIDTEKKAYRLVDVEDNE